MIHCSSATRRPPRAVPPLGRCSAAGAKGRWQNMAAFSLPCSERVYRRLEGHIPGDRGGDIG